MNIGQLDRQVTLQKPTAAPANLYGGSGQQQVFTDVATVAARVEPVNGGEAVTAEQLTATARQKITIRHRPDVQPTWQLGSTAAPTRLPTCSNSGGVSGLFYSCILVANRSGIQFQGIEELSQVLAGFNDKMGAQVVDKILRKSAQPMLRRAKELSSNADVTGDTTKSIGIIANRKTNTIKLGPRRGNGFKGYHAHLLEYGTAPHIIKAKAAGGLLVWAGGAATQVQHPGIAPQPFMRPAFDSTHGAVVESIKGQCREIIETGFKSVFK